ILKGVSSSNSLLTFTPFILFSPDVTPCFAFCNNVLNLFPLGCKDTIFLRYGTYSPFSSIVALVVCAFEILEDATSILNRWAVNELALVFNESKIDIKITYLPVQHFESFEIFHLFGQLNYDEIFDFLLNQPFLCRYRHYSHCD